MSTNGIEENHRRSEYIRQTESNKVVYWQPTLFSLMLSPMPTGAFQDCYDGFPIRYRVCGKVFNLRMQGKSNVQTDVLCQLLYADDVETLDRVSQACINYDLTIRKKRTKIVYSQYLESPQLSHPS